MKFSISIPAATIGVLFATIILNIIGLKISFETHFPEYLSRLNRRVTSENTLNPDGIRSLFDIKNLDKDTQKDYEVALNELSLLSSSLESISKNPELYVASPPFTTATGEKNWYVSVHFFSPDKISESYQNSILSILRQPFAFSKNTPEYEFLSKIFKHFLILNFAWMSFVMVLYVLWIRKIFRPIHTIIDRLENISFVKNHPKIIYKKRNEFLPIFTAINSLQLSLSNQEWIRNQFLADMSHEIRTPITAVSCLLEAINDGVMKVNPETIKILQFEMKRLTNITEHIMNHEKFLNELSVILPKERFLLKNFIANIAHQYESQFQKNNQKISYNIPVNLKILFNKEYFAQILHNIFSNFYKYAWKNTVLTLSARPQKNVLILDFADNGIGIPDEDLQLVREKFFKKDMGRNQDEYLSMGIGFSVIDRILMMQDSHMKLLKNETGWLTVRLQFPH